MAVQGAVGVLGGCAPPIHESHEGLPPAYGRSQAPWCPGLFQMIKTSVTLTRRVPAVNMIQHALYVGVHVPRCVERLEVVAKTSG